jgi:hypothetical protein
MLVIDYSTACLFDLSTHHFSPPSFRGQRPWFTVYFFSSVNSLLLLNVKKDRFVSLAEQRRQRKRKEDAG